MLQNISISNKPFLFFFGQQPFS